MNYRLIGFSSSCLTLLLLSSSILAESREWVDSTGLYSVVATLIAYDEHSVVLKVDQKANKKSHDLLAIPIDKLSTKDRDYLSSKEAELAQKEMDKPQTWTMRNGMKVVGKMVDYTRRDVTIQRRRNKVYVNDQLLTNLPEIYQKFIPKIVEHFDQVAIPDERAFQNWMVKQKANPRTFHCEGVVIEFENGEEYAIPFFFFSEQDMKMLEPGWERWVQYADDHEQKQKESLYLQSQAMAYQRAQQEAQQQSQKMAMVQLEMLAIGAGVTSLWEVYLEPGPSVRGYPMVAVVSGRDSDQASYMALQKYPGYVIAAVKKVAGRY